MESHQKQFLYNGCGLLLWTILSASINTASIMEKQKLDDGLGWPAFGTFAWLAVMYAILSIGMTFSNKTLAQVANNACLCCLFSGLVVAQLAPFYVGKWKEIEEPLAHQKMDICVIVFSSFSILGKFDFVSRSSILSLLISKRILLN